MYDELVKRIRGCSYSDPNGCEECRDCPNAENYYECKQKLALQAADAIEELSKQVEQLPRWIPVTEQPPLEVGDDGYNGYLVFANGYYEVADYASDEFDNVPYFHVDGEWEPTVTHFMPLPEPPKEEEANV